LRPSSTRPEPPRAAVRRGLAATAAALGVRAPARRTAFGLACALAALLPAALPGTAPAAKPGGFGRAMLRELNRVRAIHHLPRLREDRRMDRGAAGHSRDMARHGYFAHGSWTGRVMAAAGSARSIGEVIGWRAQARPRTEAFQLVHMWLASPPHRANLLDGTFRRAGIGRATSGRNAFYTVDFATG
jgi:uncharacterized protein YkwD